MLRPTRNQGMNMKKLKLLLVLCISAILFLWGTKQTVHIF